MDDLISRIDEVLDEPDDESLDDWQYPWSDAWRWAPEGVELPEEVWEDDRELDDDGEYIDPQIHVIPVEQVAEWTARLETLPPAERAGIDWYVVCFGCMTAGERTVDCGCRNPAVQAIPGNITLRDALPSAIFRRKSLAGPTTCCGVTPASTLCGGLRRVWCSASCRTRGWQVRRDSEVVEDDEVAG